MFAGHIDLIVSHCIPPHLATSHCIPLHIAARQAGEVSITQATSGMFGSGQKEIGKRKPGEYIGERALITAEPRTATGTALTDVTCLCLDRKTFTTHLLGSENRSLMQRESVRCSHIQ